MKNIYLHIPFCYTKCSYCTFPIYAIGKSSANKNYQFNKELNNLFDLYTNSLIYEMSSFFSSQKNNFQIESIYFGGGTPSLINEKNIEKIFISLKKYVEIQKNCEITMEFNPNSFTADKLNFLCDLGLNRVSLGIQSFNNKVLEFLNRNHNENEIYKAIDILKNNLIFKNFSNVSFDIIFNTIFDLNTNNLEFDLKKSLKENPGHLSIYSLTIDESSVLYKKNIREEKYPLPDQNTSAENYIFIHKYLKENGYNHYEISNFSNNKKNESKHNKVYWNGDQDFLAFGMGASSLINNIRFTRPKSLKKYFEFVDELKTIVIILRNNFRTMKIL